MNKKCLGLLEFVGFTGCLVLCYGFGYKVAGPLLREAIINLQ